MSDYSYFGMYKTSWGFANSFDELLFRSQGKEFEFSRVTKVYYNEYIDTVYGLYRKPLFASGDRVVNLCVSELPKGVQCSIVHEGKEPVRLRGGKTGYKYERDVETVTVPKEVSQKLFDKQYAECGYKFRDHLLRNHKDLLCNLLEEEFRFNDRTKRNFIHFVAVRDCYITTDVFDDDSSYRKFYSEYGIKRLEGKAQQYGMLLALIEVIKDFHMLQITDIELLYSYQQDIGADCVLSVYMQPYKEKKATISELKDW